MKVLFSATKSLAMGIKLPKKFLHLFVDQAALFLLFFFIYFSISSNLFNHTNFWFFLSNTLIFIIAADSGAFSPPPRFIAVDAKTNRTPPQHNYSKTLVVNEPSNSTIPTHNDDDEEEIIPLIKGISVPPKFNNPRKSYKRSKSEKEIKRLGEKVREITMKRSKTMMIRHDETSTRIVKEKEKDEFEELTNEELNKRVEEFIERFNRQIRLQEN